MNFISLDTLTIPENRHRREFDEKKISDLADSIADKGLLHPIVLHNDGHTLVAGERRTRAMRLLHKQARPFHCSGEPVPPGMLPYTSLGSLTGFQLREAELEENVLRVDLSWQEKASALAELHTLRTEQAQAAGRKHTVRDTIEELIGEANPATMYRDINTANTLAPFLDDPEISGAKTEKDALKIVERRRTAAHREKLAASFDTRKSPHKGIRGDTLEHLPKIAPESFDVILTDPPYGMGADAFGDMASQQHEYEDSLEWFSAAMPQVITELTRVAKPSAHCYMFCDPDNFHFLRREFVSNGWQVFRTPLIWAKGGGMLPLPDHGPRRTYEIILFAFRGDRKTTGVFPDVIQIPKLARPRFGAEKPPALYADLLNRSVLPGDHVFDPFAGVGPIIPAANALQCRATFIELSEEKYNVILERLMQSDLTPEEEA